MGRKCGKTAKTDAKTVLKGAILVNGWMQAVRLAAVQAAASYATNAFIDEEIECRVI